MLRISWNPVHARSRPAPSDLTATALAGDVTFDVTAANVPWAITQASPVSWISTIAPETGDDDQQITITYEQNTALTEREAILTLAATDGGRETENITLTQEAAARELSVDNANISISSVAGRTVINVTANVPWRITKRVADTFITTIAPETGNNDQIITITYEENTALTSRDAVLTLVATGAGATESVTITLTQGAAGRELAADKTSITVLDVAGRVTFNVSANVPWAITQASPASWISTISPETGSDNQKITVTYAQNAGATSREAILTLAATGVGATETVTHYPYAERRRCPCAVGGSFQPQSLCRCRRYYF